MFMFGSGSGGNLWVTEWVLGWAGLGSAGSACAVPSAVPSPFDSMWRCPRSISTVVCVHEPACDPPDCSGHGLCVAGHCHCDSHFWAGPACDTLDCGPANCSLHGVCSACESLGRHGGACGGDASLGNVPGKYGVPACQTPAGWVGLLPLCSRD